MRKRHYFIQMGNNLNILKIYVASNMMENSLALHIVAIKNEKFLDPSNIFFEK